MNAMNFAGMQQPDGLLSEDVLNSMSPPGESALSMFNSLTEQGQGLASIVKTINLAIEASELAQGISNGDMGTFARSLLGIVDEFMDLHKQESVDFSSDMSEDEQTDFSLVPS